MLLTGTSRPRSLVVCGSGFTEFAGRILTIILAYVVEDMEGIPQVPQHFLSPFSAIFFSLDKVHGYRREFSLEDHT